MKKWLLVLCLTVISILGVSAMGLAQDVQINFGLLVNGDQNVWTLDGSGSIGASVTTISFPDGAIHMNEGTYFLVIHKEVSPVFSVWGGLGLGTKLGTQEISKDIDGDGQPEQVTETVISDSSLGCTLGASGRVNLFGNIDGIATVKSEYLFGKIAVGYGASLVYRVADDIPVGFELGYMKEPLSGVDGVYVGVNAHSW